MQTDCNGNFSNDWNRVALKFQVLKTQRIAACINGVSQRAYTLFWNNKETELPHILAYKSKNIIHLLPNIFPTRIINISMYLSIHVDPMNLSVWLHNKTFFFNFGQIWPNIFSIWLILGSLILEYIRSILSLILILNQCLLKFSVYKFAKKKIDCG